MAGAKQKTHSVAAAHERIGEQGAKLAKEARKAAVSEAGESGKTFLKQLLGLELGGASQKTEKHAPKKEDEKPDTGGVVELFNALTHKQNTEKKSSGEKTPHIEAAMNYSREIAQSSERAVKSEKHTFRNEVEEIKAELQNLLASSKVLQMEFAEVAMEQAPVDAGEYHKTFFDWMLIVIRQARQKVEDSGAWLNAVKGKRSGKASTDFSIANGKMHQSGERTTIQNAAG